MKTLLKRFVYALLALIALAGCAVAIEYFGGQPMGLFAGTRPAGLGFSSGKFAPPTWKPNCVSSTVDKSDEKHYIAPIAFAGGASDAWKKLGSVVRSNPRALSVAENASYLYAEFKSPGLGFVDDVEFALDEKASVIHVRSASRLGVRDFGANRNRIDAIRTAFGK
ncbi:MAG: DUF1499 domain-containing protein [Usitatibacteraceae bacterium]